MRGSCVYNFARNYAIDAVVNCFGDRCVNDGWHRKNAHSNGIMACEAYAMQIGINPPSPRFIHEIISV
jgi:hypothetical protein